MDRVTTFAQRGSAPEPISPGVATARRPGGKWVGLLLGIVALGSGAALVAYILAHISLVVGLAFAVLVQIAASFAVWSRALPAQRRRLRTVALVGLLSGLLATAMYDLTKFALSHLEASVYNPLEAIRMFGIVLLGKSAPQISAYSVGAAYHALNGTMFGVAFALLFGRGGVLMGIVWGFFLETFQIALFPGWLNIRAYQEFAQVSALSHLVYGSVLGLTCQRWLVERQGIAGIPPRGRNG